jgi:hypothetical protein
MHHPELRLVLLHADGRECGDEEAAPAGEVRGHSTTWSARTRTD